MTTQTCQTCTKSFATYWYNTDVITDVCRVCHKKRRQAARRRNYSQAERDTARAERSVSPREFVESTAALRPSHVRGVETYSPEWYEMQQQAFVAHMVGLGIPRTGSRPPEHSSSGR